MIDNFFIDQDGVYKSKNNRAVFSYSDGKKNEDYILNTLNTIEDLSIASDEFRENIIDWVSEYHFSQERHNLLRHLSLNKDMNILELGCGCGAITRQFGECGAKVTSIEGSLQRARSAASRCRDLNNVKVYCSNFQDILFNEKYDVVTFIGVLEYCRQYFNSPDPVNECLKIALNALKPEGVLVIAIENQLGLKYFCGYREDHVDIPFFGIEDRYSDQTAITFGKQELTSILHKLGLSQVQFNYPFPDYKIPKVIFTEKAFTEKKFHPEDLISQMQSRDYSGKLTPAFDEFLAVPVLCRNNLMTDLSHSFLVLASRESYGIDFLCDPNLLAVNYTTDRSRSYNIKTNFMHSVDMINVQKKYLFPRKGRSNSMLTLSHQLKDDDYIVGKNLQIEYKKCVLLNDFDKLFKLFKLQIKFFESNAIMKYNQKNPALALIYPEFIDCVPSNLIIEESHIRYIDREWKLNYPLSFGVLLIRTVDALHALNKTCPELSKDNLFRFLNELGYILDVNIINKYNKLISDITSQVYLR